MGERADVIVVGAGVQGASIAFHLAGRGADVLVLERTGVAAGATGRSSGFVRMHYDLASEAAFAWRSYPYFRDWAERVGAGDCGFVRTGFVQLVEPELEGALRSNVAAMQSLGIETELIGPEALRELVPGIVTEDITVAAYEPGSGYADPSGTAAGFLAAARRGGARFQNHARVDSVLVDGDQVVGVSTERGRIAAPVVVNAAGAWAGRLAATAGVDLPIEPWRHDTFYLGKPDGAPASLPVLIDNVTRAYFRPEGHDLLLVASSTGSELGGDPDRPEAGPDPRLMEDVVERICRRVPWIVEGTFRTAHGGQDGITPDQRAVLGAAGPDGFYLACGFSGTGFKTAPAIGDAIARLILDGEGAVKLAPYSADRFAAGRFLVGEHPYGELWSAAR